MKPTFSDLPIELQSTFGNGCSLVPDFIFTANCRHHDFNYERGGSFADKIKADYDMCRLMWLDSFKVWHYIVTFVYWIGLTCLPISYFTFCWSLRYKTLQEIIDIEYGNSI